MDEHILLELQQEKEFCERRIREIDRMIKHPMDCQCLECIQDD